MAIHVDMLWYIPVCSKLMSIHICTAHLQECRPLQQCGPQAT